MSFARVVSPYLPVSANTMTGKVEYYDGAHRRWFPCGGAIRFRGDQVNEARQNCFRPWRLQLVEGPPKCKKWVPVYSDLVDKLYDANFLGNVSPMVKSCSRDLPPLDGDELRFCVPERQGL